MLYDLRYLYSFAYPLVVLAICLGSSLSIGFLYPLYLEALEARQEDNVCSHEVNHWISVTQSEVKPIPKLPSSSPDLRELPSAFFSIL